MLQNGTGASDASNVSADHAVSVEPVLADSIEVIRGPATLLYGNGAIGGVVNVIDNRIPDKVPEQTTGILEIRYGTAAEEETTVARIDGGSGAFAFHLSGVYRDWNDVDIPGKAIDENAVADPDHQEPVENTDGFIANSDGITKSGTVGGSWVFDSGHIGIAYNHLDNEYGIPPGAHSHHEEGDEEEEYETHTLTDRRGEAGTDQFEPRCAEQSEDENCVESQLADRDDDRDEHGRSHVSIRPERAFEDVETLRLPA